jgi:ribosomal protein S18 acetylase RimI-like enzyme
MNPVITLRAARPTDYSPIIDVLDAWWGGRQMAAMLPKLFFVHFQSSSLVAEAAGERVGFLIGFHSPDHPDESYIHFVGVHPAWRGAGVGRLLYEQFFKLAAAAGRRHVRCVTSPVNLVSIQFHLRMGFQVEPGDSQQQGISFHWDYDGPGEDRVLFIKHLP